MPSRFNLLCLILPLAGLTISCASGPADPPTTGGTPLGLQMLRTEAQMQRYPFRTLQTFEQPVDLAFVRAEGGAPSLDGARAHTGGSSVSLPSGTSLLEVRLPSLLSGVQWPGQWTLLGAYFYSSQPQRITASYEIDGVARLLYPVELPAGQWTPLLLDISSIEGTDASKIGMLRFSFTGGLTRTAWCDDVIILNNTEIKAQAPAEGWSVRERGFATIIERTAAFRESVRTPEADEQGWELTEANAIRATLKQRATGRLRTIYSDGREFSEGSARVLGGIAADDSALRPLREPARIAITGDVGRLDRNSAGDANNDGYSELSGAYQLIAAGPRLQFTIEPSGGPLARVAVEVKGLPAGEVLATMEGRLVEKLARLDDGRVLIELPGTLSRMTTVNVRAGQ